MTRHSTLKLVLTFNHIYCTKKFTITQEFNLMVKLLISKIQ